MATPTSNKPTQINFFLNQAPKAKAFQLGKAFQNIPLPTYQTDNACFYDIDNDGNVDLLLGKTQGNLEYYKNMGSYKFIKQSNNFLGIGINIYFHNLGISVADVDGNGKPDLVSGDDSGFIKIYANFSRQF